VRFLVDENLSLLVVDLLRGSGHDAVHVRDIGLRSAGDREILERARSEDRVLVSADTDFGRILAASGSTSPSVILLRREGSRRASAQVDLILANLEQVSTDLDAGAVVVLDATRVRVRRLPVSPPEADRG
jgi:predicted nuclease of predicted toxin-antitoxin system